MWSSSNVKRFEGDITLPLPSAVSGLSSPAEKETDAFLLTATAGTADCDGIDGDDSDVGDGEGVKSGALLDRSNGRLVGLLLLLIQSVCSGDLG